MYIKQYFLLDFFKRVIYRDNQEIYSRILFKQRYTYLYDELLLNLHILYVIFDL
jgi:hypothetical protein